MPHLHDISKDGPEVFNLNNCEVIEGYLPPRIHKKVKKWIEYNKNELLNIWNKALIGEYDGEKINPLK